MRSRTIYFLAIAAFAMLAFSRIASAQNCEMNMLVIPDADSYAAMPDLPLNMPSAALTVECWAKATALQSGAGLIEFGAGNDIGTFSLRFGTGQTLIATLRLDNGIANISTPSLPIVTQWHHYALTFNPNDSICLYVDGVLSAGISTTASSLSVSSYTLVIGRSLTTETSFAGDIDEARIWAVARTASEIKSTMTTPLSGSENGLRYYYPFDDDPQASFIHNFAFRGNDLSKIANAFLDASTSPVAEPPQLGYMLGVKQSNVNFADLLCSDTETFTVDVYNRGAEEIKLGGIGVQNAKVFSVSTASGFPLPPGDSTRTAHITIEANATKPGLYEDELLISSSTICGGQVSVHLQVRKDSIGMTFDDSVFNLHDLLDCNLPLIRSAHLRNTGTEPITISSLAFIPAAPITILSPTVPFVIDTGVTQEIKLEFESGPSVAINSALRAEARECSAQSSIIFQGHRVAQQISFPDSVAFAPIHLPTTPLKLDTTIVIKNSGSSILYFNPSIGIVGSSAFQLLSPVSGLVSPLAPDSSLLLKVQFTATSCGSFETALLLHFRDTRDCQLDTTIAISAVVLGPLVASVSDTFDLGAGCFLRDTTITFHNESGRTVLMGYPSFSKNNVMSFLSPQALPAQLNPGDSISLSFGFSPTFPGDYSLDAHFPLSPCGETVVTFNAIYGVGKFYSKDSVVDFGTSCDLTPETDTIRIRNLAGKNVTVTDSALSSGSGFTIVSPTLPFTIADSDAVTISVRYMPSSIGVSRGSIMLFDSGCYVTTITAKAVREHANVLATPSAVEFGTTCPNDTSRTSLLLTNLGNGLVSIDTAIIIGSPAFFIPVSVGDTILNGLSQYIKIGFIPSDTISYSANVKFIFGPCGDTAVYPLHGAGGPKPQIIATDTAINFGTVKIGYPDSICVQITNPSCLPAILSASSFGTAASPFRYESAVVADSVTATEPMQICFICSPDSVGTFVASDTIVGAGQTIILTLSARAVKTDLQLAHRIDFGDVPIDSIKILALEIQNLGDTGTTIDAIRIPSGDFSAPLPIDSIGATPSIIYDSLQFLPTGFGLQFDTLVLAWDKTLDTIILQGRGVGAGPLFSLSDILFGNVRLKHDSSVTVAVSATKTLPITITSFAMDNPVFAITSADGQTINTTADTIHYTITYSPIAETHDTATLSLVTSASSNVSLDVDGTGVEAHLSVSDSLIDFGTTAIHSAAATHLFIINNTGGYPLLLKSVSTPNPVFSVAPNPLGANPVAPHSSTNVTVDFQPLRGKIYFDSLVITADAPEINRTTLLRGEGTFAPLGYPQITYTLPNIQARVGDIVAIPIEIAGVDIGAVDIDSFYLDIAYDPQVVFIHSASAGEIASGSTITLTQIAKDTIRVGGFGSLLEGVPGVVCMLEAEALLGPRDSTGLIISQSNPLNTATLQSSSGSFVVTDCGNYKGGIIIEGNYSLSGATPNPSNGIITIPYELGLAAHVTIDLYDQLGRNVKSLLDADRGVGPHTLVATISDLPSGEYYYVLKSLEYRASQKVVLSK